MLLNRNRLPIVGTKKPSRPTRRRKALALEELEPRINMSAPMVATSYFDGAMYEFDSGTGRLEQTLIAPTAQTTQYVPAGVLNGPAGIAVGPDGNLYISSQDGNQILRYNLTTDTLDSTPFISSTVLQNYVHTVADPSNPEAQFGPAGLAFGPDGNLYVLLNGTEADTDSDGQVVRFNILNNNGVLSYNTSSTPTEVGSGGMFLPSDLTFGTAAGDTNNLYVTDTVDDVIDKITNATSGSSSQGLFFNGASVGMEFPTSLSWSADGNLYVVDEGVKDAQGTVWRINAAGTSAQRVIAENGELFDQFPNGIAFNGQGSMLIANLGSSAGPPTALNGSIMQFNTDGTYLQTLDGSPGNYQVSGGFGPSELVVLPTSVPLVASSFFDGGLYEVDSLTGNVEKTLIAPSSFSGETPAGTLDGPSAMTIGPDGNLYISSQDGNQILRFNLTTDTLDSTPFISSTVLENYAHSVNGSSALFAPAGLEFGPDGNLYVVLNGGQGDFNSDGQVVRFDILNTGGVLSYNTGSTPVEIGNGGMFQPSDLTFGTATGDTTSLYVSDTVDRLIDKITTATTTPTQSMTPFINAGAAGMEFPTGLTWGPDGDLYIADLGAGDGQGNIFQYDPNTAMITKITPTTMGASGNLFNQFPTAILFDPQGNLLTANLGGNPNTGGVFDYGTTGTFNTLVSSSQFTNGVSVSQLVIAPPEVTSVTVNGDTAPILNASESGTIVTVNTDGPSGFQLGQVVSVAGVAVGSDATDDNGYNGVWTIIGLGTDSFTYTSEQSGLTAANNYSGTATTNQIPTSAISEAVESTAGAGTTVTVTTNGANGYVVGQSVTIAGVAISGSTINAYNGTFTVTGATATTLTYTASMSGLAQADAGTGTASTGTGLLVGPQRSMVDSVVYKFNQAVSLGSGAISLAVHGGVTGTANAANAPNVVYATTDGGYTWIATFVTGNGAKVSANSIADGVYDVTLNNSAVAAVGGDGTLASSRADTFWRLFGDFTGSASVNTIDRVRFNAAYASMAGAANFFAAFDDGVNGGGISGNITNIDRILFNAQSGKAFTGFTATI